MSLVMLRRAWRDQAGNAASYAVGIILYSAMILAFFPVARDHAAAFNSYLSAMPQALIRAFGISDFSTFSGFVGAELLRIIWPIIVEVFAIMSGAALVAQEIERGTAEIWLSVPESRARLLASKIAALFLAELGLVIVTVITLAIGAVILGEPVVLSRLLVLGVVLLSLSIVVAGYSVLFSAFFDARGRPAGIAAGVTIAFYMLWVASSFGSSWSWLRYLSIYAAFQPQAALGGDPIPVLGVIALFIIGLACAGASLVVFQRRDVAV
ncbi:MAG TPA: ABC transporter permease subunit [Thermomicrobiaceae bacterium]|nr:ABC transporter permease subunit [Thermomicrobiaceae bacterium]